MPPEGDGIPVERREIDWLYVTKPWCVGPNLEKSRVSESLAGKSRRLYDLDALEQIKKPARGSREEREEDATLKAKTDNRGDQKGFTNQCYPFFIHFKLDSDV